MFSKFIETGQHENTISVLFVFTDRIPPSHRDPESSFLRSIANNGIFLSLINSGGVVSLIPSYGVIVGIGSDLPRITVVVNFPRACGEIAIVSKQLPQCDNIRVLLTQLVLQRVHIQGVGTQASHQAGTTGTT